MIKPGDLIFDNFKGMQGMIIEVISPSSNEIYSADYTVLYNDGTIEGAYLNDIDYLENCFPFCMKDK